jgi:NAD-dependent deacetylase
MRSPNIVILTGSSVSAESGLTTFRDSGGLWENYDIHVVASIDGWHQDPALVLDFYNKRRAQAKQAEPNAGHRAIADIQKAFNAKLITQNVDDLHERGGSDQVLHLHGELSKVRSTVNPEYIVDIGSDSIHLGDICPLGGQLRPDIVWFGEMVPNIEVAAAWCAEADILIVAGTSLLVYPASGLIHEIPEHAEIYIVDPSVPIVNGPNTIHAIAEKGTTGLVKLHQQLLERFPDPS